ncbi:hypothetical protein [Desulfoscipio geothermicus]|uniref:Uncharacterized protein n=1 Tax=Desulfoscipio geothermicus DSM 3669 TaxID=1121426 RepID=A0A1I6EI15_9FIRM|nr:hypothetical protein [Desulfoscipio geothermicus]SFR17406.1 hypothetical protein SAMN05660706_1473 [Desulfoscipio geothermicus DSM 3669]
MRLIARLPNKDQVGFLVDSLRNAGFDRKDMIISDLGKAEKQRRDDPEEVADELAFVKTEREGLWETGAYADGIKGLEPGKRGIIVAVKTPKHESDRVRAIMEQSGAAEIIQD